MFPNKFVVMWDGEPCKLSSHGHFRKVDDPNRVAWFDRREDAEIAIIRFGDYLMKTIEVQFVEKP